MFTVQQAAQLQQAQQQTTQSAQAQQAPLQATDIQNVSFNISHIRISKNDTT